MSRRITKLSLDLLELGKGYSQYKISESKDFIQIGTASKNIKVTMKNGLIVIQDNLANEILVNQRLPIQTIQDWIDENT